MLSRPFKPQLAGLVLAALAFPAAPAQADTSVIAFLMPCSACADRFDALDTPAFIAAVEALDARATVIAYNAYGSGSVQVGQAEAALTAGADVIVLSPMTEAAASAIVTMAQAENVPIISYDTLVTAAPIDFHVSFRNERVGELQARYLLDNLARGSTIVMLNGPQDVETGRLFKSGSHKILDPAVKAGDIVIGYEADIAGWAPADAQAKTEWALSLLQDGIDGVLVANDGMAGGAITALSLNDLDGAVLVTGQDATDAALQRILTGDQSMTVYKAVTAEAKTAAEIAFLLAEGRYSEAEYAANARIDNGAGLVPSVLLDPIVVTADTIGETVLAEGFTSRERICVGEAAEAEACWD